MICTRCPVRVKCLEFALATQQAYGIWGGTSEEERRRILARGSATPHPARTRLKTRAKSRMPVAPGWPR
ncbi:MAG TPA: WhiB family transcriptional regulator [Streptosporangiaceae bacterium]